MRLLYSYLVCLLVFAACKNSGSDNPVSKADSLVVNFNTPQTNNIEKTVTTTEKNAIKKIARFLDNKPAENYKCGYDGNLLFYEKGKLAADISFNFSGEGCRHFIQMENDQITTSVMSNEAVDFFKSLYEGKNWY